MQRLKLKGFSAFNCAEIKSRDKALLYFLVAWRTEWQHDKVAARSWVGNEWSPRQKIYTREFSRSWDITATKTLLLRNLIFSIALFMLKSDFLLQHFYV